VQDLHEVYRLHFLRQAQEARNEARGSSGLVCKYTDKVLLIRGILRQVNQRGGGYAALLTDAGYGSEVACLFPASQVERLAALQVDREAIVLGICRGQIDDYILVENCRVAADRSAPARR
jgi:hypothetical protein